MSLVSRFIDVFNDEAVARLGIKGHFVKSQHLGEVDATGQVVLYTMIRGDNGDEHEVAHLDRVLFDPDADDEFNTSVIDNLADPLKDTGEEHDRLVRKLIDAGLADPEAT